MLPFLSPILDIVNKFIPSEDKKIELQKEILKHESELEKAFQKYAQLDHDLRIKEMEHTGFKASWRPYIMFSLSTVVVLHLLLAYVVPYIAYYSGYDPFIMVSIGVPNIPMPDIAWQVFAFCVVGVSGLRTLDKWRK
jgi:hypothetical protein